MSSNSKDDFVNYLKNSVLFKNMPADQQQSLLKMAETASDEKLTAALLSIKKADDDMEASKKQSNLNVEAAETELANLNNQMKSLRNKELKLNEKDEVEEAQAGAADILKQLKNL